MRSYILIVALVMTASTVFSQTTADADLANTVEALRKAMVDPDKTALQKLTHTDLSYGHSSGKIENRDAFMQSLLNGDSDFKSLTISGQTIQIAGNTAIVRHKLSGDTHDKGKDPGKINLGVMLVFVKDGDAWKLIGRQAYKI